MNIKNPIEKFSDVQVQEWLEKEGFKKYKERFETFLGRDMLDIDLIDFITFCDNDIDGREIYRKLHEKDNVVVVEDEKKLESISKVTHREQDFSYVKQCII